MNSGADNAPEFIFSARIAAFIGMMRPERPETAGMNCGIKSRRTRAVC